VVGGWWLVVEGWCSVISIYGWQFLSLLESLDQSVQHSANAVNALAKSVVISGVT
jgi:hypothetical protein